MKPYKMISLAALAVAAFSFAAFKPESVKIGNQVWMKKNMNVATENSWCYDDKPENCEKYGRLYEWEDAKKVCPSGWHLPTINEFETLLEYLGESRGKSNSIKIRSQEWGNGVDEYGLSVLPSGERGSGGSFDGNFYGLGQRTYWWSSTEEDGDYAVCLEVNEHSAELFYRAIESGLSVHCIKDKK